MDEKLQELMQELGNAINDSLSDSDRIGHAISEIRQAGYDIFLVLECTIGFNKRDDAPEPEPEIPPPPAPATEGSGKLKFTSQDLKFMRAMKISLDPDNPPKK